MESILIIALAASVALHLYQTRRAAVLGHDASWQVHSQGRWHWRRPRLALLARVLPVDVVHFDVDKLKLVNAVLGEDGANALLGMALRGSDVYRLQHGDECVALVPAGDGVALAWSLHGRLSRLPLSETERSALDGPISATIVVIRTVRNVGAAVRLAVATREALKRGDRRGDVAVIEGDQL